jgi:acetyltransferase-like isoleucine patch superfamily enzyme
VSFLPLSQHPVIPSTSPQFRWRYGWLKGWLYYRPLWAFRHRMGWGPRVIWGQRISVWGTPKVRGQGLVDLGHDVILDGQATLFVYGGNAVLKVGACTIINSTRFGCTNRIEIGERCLVADARIMDSDFHNTGRQRLNPLAPVPSKPIIIGNNVWVAAASVILKGVQIGDDSILAFGALASRSIPPGRIYGGNPARDVGPVKETQFLAPAEA